MSGRKPSNTFQKKKKKKKTEREANLCPWCAVNKSTSSEESCGPNCITQRERLLFTLTKGELLQRYLLPFKVCSLLWLWGALCLHPDLKEDLSPTTTQSGCEKEKHNVFLFHIMLSFMFLIYTLPFFFFFFFIKEYIILKMQGSFAPRVPCHHTRPAV